MALFGGVAGSESGKKVVYGDFIPTAGTTALDLGDRLTSVDSVVLALEATDMTHMWSQVNSISGTTVTIGHRKPTASGNVTPIAATTPWNRVYWMAVGDAPK